jgi:hypothetical protein
VLAKPEMTEDDEATWEAMKDLLVTSAMGEKQPTD